VRTTTKAAIPVLGLVLSLAGAGCSSDSGGGSTTTPPTTSGGTTTPVTTGGATRPPAVVGHVTPQPAPPQVACGADTPADANAPKPQFASAPPMLIDPAKTYTAVVETSCGAITIELADDTAPVTVNSFVFLAQQHYFDGQHIHRLDTSIDVIQGGDPSATGSGGPGYSIPDELSGSDTYGPGTLAMANAGPNTGGSQFFLISGPNGHLLDNNPNYTVFGHIVSGLDVAQRIQGLPIQDPQAAAAGDLRGQQPKQAVYLEKVTIKVS
jgi:cyclophilin family peptidyl-prolyl cis-trans isomerase